MEMHDVTAQDPKFLVFLKVSDLLKKLLLFLIVLKNNYN